MEKPEDLPASPPATVASGPWRGGTKACPSCGTRFASKDALRLHRKSAHPATCDVCQKAFATADGVALHKRAVHQDQDANQG